MVEKMELKTSRNLFSSLNLSLIFIIFISASCFHQAIANSSGIESSRQVLEIGIGIGIGGTSPPASPPDNADIPPCPEPAPPPPPECPPPPPPPTSPSPPPRKSISPPPPPTSPSPPPPKLSPPKPHRPPPSPPPPGTPKPSSPPFVSPGFFDNKQQILDTIKHFRRLITKDPSGITKTWTGENICIDKTKYIGFVCDTTRDTNKLGVAGIKFNGRRFGGKFSLDDILGNFTGIIFFHANSNGFKKGVPNVFKKLRTLYEFDMSNNQLTGGFPTAVFAGNLTFLDLRFNYFTGRVPPQAFNLDLDALFLNNNMFSGNIPDNLGSTPAVFLTLANNMFTGPIPTSIGKAGNTLLEVLFLNNRLSGCLPYEIGKLKKAELFDASGNELTGPIPMSFGCLQSMETLNFANNHLYGAVPEELCSIKSLDKLTLKFNYFTQVGPKCRELIDRGILDVSMNCIIDLKSQRRPETCKDFFLKHPHDNCPVQRHVPCKIERSATQLTDEHARKKPSKHSRAYAALHRHHH